MRRIFTGSLLVIFSLACVAQTKINPNTQIGGPLVNTNLMLPGVASDGASGVNVVGNVAAGTMTDQNKSVVLPASPLVALAAFDFNQLSSTAAHDITGNGHDCTLYSGLSTPVLPLIGNGSLILNANYKQGCFTNVPMSSVKAIAMRVNPKLLVDGTIHALWTETAPGICGTAFISSSTSYPSNGGIIYDEGVVTGLPSGELADIIWVPGSPDVIYVNGIPTTWPQGTISSGSACQTGNLGFGATNGVTGASGYFNGSITEFAAYGSVPTTAQALQIHAQLVAADNAKNYQKITQNGYAQRNIMFVGDSRTWGVGGSGTTIASAATPLLYTTGNMGAWSSQTFATPGQTMCLAASQITNSISQINPAAHDNVFVIWGVLNDYNSGLGNVVSQACTQNVVNALKTAMPTARVFVATEIYAYNSGWFNAYQGVYNQWLRRNYTTIGADGIVDFGADPIMGSSAGCTATYFSDYPSCQHPTAAGYTILGQIAANAINAYFGASTAFPIFTTTSGYQMLTGDRSLAANIGSGGSVTLPACSGLTGSYLPYTVVNYSIYALTVNAHGSDQINNAPSSNVAGSNNAKFYAVTSPVSGEGSGCSWEREYPGSSISVSAPLAFDAGANGLSVATATTGSLGVVSPDGTSITISGGVLSAPGGFSASKLRTSRSSFSCAGNTLCGVTVTWGSSFADTNYTVQCGVTSAYNTNDGYNPDPTIFLNNKTASGVKAWVYSNTTAYLTGGSLVECTAIHD